MPARYQFQMRTAYQLPSTSSKSRVFFIQQSVQAEDGQSSSAGRQPLRPALQICLKGDGKGHYNIYRMYCFANNIDFGFDWQLAYNQLATHFTQLSTDYQKAIDLGEVLALKVSRITKENEEIRTAKITNMFQSTTAALPPSVAVLPQREEEITMRNLPKPAPRIKKMTSMETSEPSVFECTYQCGKIYKSTVSMNLHIKVKHNGGTKKEREEYAKAIFEAEERGESPPQPPISFPPNFLKEFRVTYEYMKKYSM